MQTRAQTLERFELLDALADPVVLVDTEGRLLGANKATAGLIGLDASELVGTSMLDYVDPRDRDEAASAFAALVDQNGPPPVELRVLRQGGAECWVEVAGNDCSRMDGVEAIVLTLRDVTARRQAQMARRESDARFEAAFDKAPIGMALVSIDGEFLRVNRALADIAGYPVTELVGRTFQSITHPDDIDDDVALLHETLAGQSTSYSMEKRYVRPDGEIVWVSLHVSLVSTAVDEDRYVVAQVLDISEHKRQQAALRRAGYIDALTELPNRRAFDERAAEIGTHECTVISCDLDNLKNVNDDLGHHTGDALLRAVATRLSACTRDRDFVARVGGDEFVLLVPESSRISADAIVERITSAVEQPVMIDAATIWPRISVGYAIQGADDQRVERTLARADAAMYRRKRIRAIESTV